MSTTRSSIIRAHVARSQVLLTARDIDASDQIVDIERIFSERPRRNLTMKDRCRDVGVISRGLSPTRVTCVRGHTYEADKLIAKRLEFADFHGFAG
jgi:hypothetical protein